nr:hypothetical protein [Tanacetum cinerariifolium]
MVSVTETVDVGIGSDGCGGGRGPANIVARRATDALIAFSGETTVPKYMKFFLVQKIAENRRFVKRMRDEAETVRGYIGQLTAVVAELQAMEDQDEVHDSLLAAKDAKRGEESKLSTLNDVIAEVLNDIETLETDVEILGGENNGGFNSLVVKVCLLSMGPFFILDKLTEVADSSRQTDKINVVFDQARKEEASFAALMRDVCCSLRVSLSKKRRLAAELEALGEQGNVVRALENMKEIVARDSMTLADVEQLLARAQVGWALRMVTWLMWKRMRSWKWKLLTFALKKKDEDGFDL